MTSDPLWFKDAVIYQLHVKSFADGDGDGVGDFVGLTSRLDHLADLGVTAVWLLPFYPSPLRDDGYDIADYDAVNPLYGSLDDFQTFVDEAHARDLKVITELVINHTSDQHPWFQRAVAAPPGSPERDFYVWSDDPTRWAETRIIFEDFEESNWTWNEQAGAYYWHRFYHHQPDLNFDNPLVLEEVGKVLDRWAATGVDGMRLDAIPYLVERDGTNNENLPETHEVLKQLRARLDRWPGRMFLAEANQWPEDAVAYFGDGDGDECHMNFHFPLMPRLYMALHQRDRTPIVDILDQTPAIPDACQWALFLRNHDELTLEMVTDEERAWMRRAYAPDPRMRINLGIRRRLAPLLGGDRARVELLTALLLSLPGTPVIYYGDEIGMGDDVALPDRDGVRTPMQWDDGRNAGFSDAAAQDLFLPVVDDPVFGYRRVNVAAQQGDPTSPLSRMRALLDLRRTTGVFGRGTFALLEPANSHVLAYVREHEGRRVVVVANLADSLQAVDLDLAAWQGLQPLDLATGAPLPEISDAPYRLTLPAHAWLWLAVDERHDRAVRLGLPVDAAALDAGTDGGDGGDGGLVELAGTWPDAVSPGGDLERHLPTLLRGWRWFGGKGRALRSTRIASTLSPAGADGRSRLLVVDVTYRDGEPEQYVLAVAWQPRSDATPSTAFAAVDGDEGRGVLVDATTDPAFCTALLHHLLGRTRTDVADQALSGEPLPWLVAAADVADLPTTRLGGEQSNTSVRYGDTVLVKLVRRIEPGPSPEAAMLAATTDFEGVPRLAGTLTWHVGGRDHVVAVGQEIVTNSGDGWTWALGTLAGLLQPVAGAPTTTPQEAAAPLRRLGTRTGELHVTLASRPANPAFDPEPLTRLQQRSLYQAMRGRATATLRRLGDAVDGISDPKTAQAAGALLARRRELLAAFDVLTDRLLDGRRIRTHGDLHLGQVLRAGHDWLLIDFEGEPAASYDERRLKRLPLRDVAGMLRSFDYAAAVALHDAVFSRHGTDELDLRATALGWRDAATTAYVDGYLATVDGHGLVPANRDDIQRLIDVHLLDKALYEITYELDNRPDWLWLPLRGVHDLLDRSPDLDG